MTSFSMTLGVSDHVVFGLSKVVCFVVKYVQKGVLCITTVVYAYIFSANEAYVALESMLTPDQTYAIFGN